MNKALNLGSLTLPREAVTSTIVVYGGKGQGKTNFLAVFSEELAAQKLRFSVIDPVGVSWGLQHGAKRGMPGLEVLILGGVHGDIPIEPTAGAVVADLVADESVSTVIDISRRADGRMWTHGEKIRFVADYCTRLYERQGERRIPLMQIIDEAGRFVPQQIPHGSIDIARSVGAIEQLVELGRNVAVGVTLVTQRSARMNKSVSELADCMISFRTIGPNSVEAVLDWLGDHIEKARHKEMIEKLRMLDVGQALVVSPGWLRFEGLARIRARQTFDSSKTPEPGKDIAAPSKATKPDLQKYRARMLETIEAAEASDPRKLKARIAELEKLVAKPVAATKEAKPKELPALKPADRKALQTALARLGKQIEATAGELNEHRGEVAAHRNEIAKIEGKLDEHLKAARSLASVLHNALHGTTAPLIVGVKPQPGVQAFKSMDDAQRAMGHTPAPLPRSNVHATSTEKLAGGERKILSALAQYPQGRTKSQVALLTSYSQNGGGFNNYLSALRSRGLIEGSSENIRVTAAGLEALGSFTPLPTGRELRDSWLGRLGKAERAILTVLTERGSNASFSKEEVAQLTGYEPNGGGFNNALSRLRTLELITGRGEIKASAELFS